MTEVSSTCTGAGTLKGSCAWRVAVTVIGANSTLAESVRVLSFAWAAARPGTSTAGAVDRLAASSHRASLADMIGRSWDEKLGLARPARCRSAPDNGKNGQGEVFEELR